MRFQILGPIRVNVDGREVAITASRDRALLATLLLHANRLVPTDRLIEAIWADKTPQNARNQLQGCVSRLRKRLESAGITDKLIVTEPAGYRAVVQPTDLDLLNFRRLVGKARAAASDGRPDVAAASYRTALALWRGPAFTGIDSDLLASAVATLDEERARALEERLDVELARGGGGELVAELADLVQQHPHRERLHGAMMLALYRAGRQADALAAYRHARRLLQDELGIEPGVELQRTHHAILNRDPALDSVQTSGAATAAPPRRPRELPADVTAFTGREEELALVSKALATVDQVRPVLISAIDGVGGVGKSALALHAAHQVADWFPDGQLYVNLQGATDGLSPLNPLEVLSRFLRTLGVAGTEVPDRVDEAAARFRSVVAGQRLLLVLDNAADQAQVRPLLPGTPGCGVLVTSRRSLSGLDGVSVLQLGVLSKAESATLLARLVGAERIAAEPQAAEELAHWCGYLPLALRIAAARLVDRPAWPVAWLAQRLADERHRLDELEIAAVGVRVSLAVSYHTLAESEDPTDRAAAEAYALLGVWDGPELSVEVAARLLDRPERYAQRVLERLVDARLLEPILPGRYRWHDLLRLLARAEATQRYPESQRNAAIARVLRFFAATTWYSTTLLRPGDYRPAWIDERWRTDGHKFPDTDAAVAWLEAERVNLLAAIAQAAPVPDLAAAAAPLAFGMFGFLFDRHHLHDLAHVNQLALTAARRTGDRAGQASALNDLGVALDRLERCDEAMDCFHQSLAIRRDLGDQLGTAATLQHIGQTYGKLRRHEEAEAVLRQAVAINRDAGNRAGLAHNLYVVGMIYVQTDRYDEALSCLKQALDMSRETGDPSGEERSLNALGTIYVQLSRYREARECLQQCLAITQKAGYRWREAESLYRLGVVHHAEQQYAEALDRYEQSAVICRELQRRDDEAEVLRDMGVTLQALGRADQARHHWQEALSILEDLGHPAAGDVRALMAEA